jgi:uncharacterized protein (DUF2147 family)
MRIVSSAFSRAPRRQSYSVVMVLAASATGVFAQGAAQQVPAKPAALDVAGIWIDHSGQGAVEIAQCGASVCGRVFWIREAVDTSGRPITDQRNPDQAKRGSPICGLQIIGELKRQPNGAWDGGWIYNPEDGGRFSVEIQLRNRDQLQVVGYAGIKFLGQTFVWKRAPANLSKCDLQGKRSI